MELASKGYVDRFAAIKYYYEATIGQTLPNARGIYQLALLDHEVNINSVFYDNDHYMNATEIMLPVVTIYDKGQEPAYLCQKYTGNLNTKIGDKATADKFLLKSKKKYGPGTYYNVEFSSNIVGDDWKAGIDGEWSGWLSTWNESGYSSLWVEGGTVGEYICVGVASFQDATRYCAIGEPLNNNSLIDKQTDNILRFLIVVKNNREAHLQFAKRISFTPEVMPPDDNSLVTTAYVNSAFGFTGGTNEIASKEYVDKINEEYMKWPEEYYPYQPDAE